MLLNISNHPSSKWTTEQLDTAKEQYGSIQDLKFPNIPPSYSQQQVGELVEDYMIQIAEAAPTAIHLMGEMTFTYAFVTSLKAAGIKCIASTTNRIVEEKEGKKIVQFQFVQFREY